MKNNMYKSLKRTPMFTIYQLTKAGNSYEIAIDRIDDESNFYHLNSQRPIPKDKIITSKEDQKFWYGNRYFVTDELMTEVIHEEIQAGMAHTPSCEEVVKFWKEFAKRNLD